MEDQFETRLIKAKKAANIRTFRVALSGIAVSLFFYFTYLYLSSYKLVVSPVEAHPYEVRSLKGVTLLVGQRLLLPFGNSDIQISSFGFEDEFRNLFSEASDKVLKVNLEYKKVELSVVHTHQLINPRWLIDDAIVSTDIFPVVPLIPGSYKLIMMSDSHDSVTQKISVKPGLNQKISIDVTRKAISLEIKSNPNGALVSINDNKVGKTPIVIRAYSGNSKIRIEKDGYETIEEEKIIKVSEKAIPLSYQLEEKKHRVNLTFSPPNGALFVNGMEREPKSIILLKANGISNLRYEAPGFESQEIIVREHERNVVFDLKPVYGNLFVESAPIANVHLDGKLIGQSPLSLKLLAKNHKLLIKAEGYKEKIISLKVAPNRRHNISENLISLDEYRLQSAPNKFINTVGLEMIKFMPKKMTMGAPRSERGQRANEQLRIVDFERSIYFSKFEITNEQYSQFDNRNEKNTRPVTNVSWDQAVLFCNWLSIKEGIKPFYKISENQVNVVEGSLGYRLPSEAEWEYVARFANKSQPSIFVWGNDYSSSKIVGNIADKSAANSVKSYFYNYDDKYPRTSPVGSFPPESSGVHDMSGNVSEWVHDYYSLKVDDGSKTLTDFLGDRDGLTRVIKGSSFLSSSWTELRAAFKGTSQGGRSDVGFRVAKYVN